MKREIYFQKLIIHFQRDDYLQTKQVAEINDQRQTSCHGDRIKVGFTSSGTNTGSGVGRLWFPLTGKRLALADSSQPWSPTLRGSAHLCGYLLFFMAVTASSLDFQ